MSTNTTPKSSRRRLLHYLQHNRVYYALWALTTLAYVAASVAFPLTVGAAMRAAEEGESRDNIVMLCGVILLVVLVRGLLRYSSRTLVFNAARQVEFEIRNDLYAHLQRLPQAFYFRWRTGDIMSRCVNDLNALRLLLGPGLLNLVQTPILFISFFVAMAMINVKLAFLVLVPYPAFILIARTFGQALHPRNIAAQEGLAELSNNLQENISGIAVVKGYAMEGLAEKRFETANQELFERQLRLVRVNASMPCIAMLLPAAAMWLILLVGGPMVESGKFSVSDFFIFAIYIYELTFPTFIMGWILALFQRGAAAMERLDEIFSTAPSIRDRSHVLPIDQIQGEIEFRNLSFSYLDDERQPALQNIDLHIPAGSTLGVVGKVGSGKTTLASVVPRLFEVDDGQLFLDGVDVNQIPLNTLRSNIAMVPQESFLFSMSLAENIAYGKPAASLDEIQQAADRAQLTNDLTELPNGFDTLVGERGVMLSGGQRQRTALARALMMNPKILILDDTLSSVDAETETLIQAELRQIFSGRTVVVVSSRVSTVREADHIIVLDEGRIVEAGTHESLEGCWWNLCSLSARASHGCRAIPGGRRRVSEALHEEEALGKAYDTRLIRRLWRYVVPYRLQVVLTILMVIPMFLLEAAPAWIIKTGLDQVKPLAESQSVLPGWLEQLFLPPPGFNLFLWLALLYLGVMLLNSLMQFVHAVLMATTGQSAMRDLRRDVFAKIQSLHMGFFDRYPVGRLVTRATNDVENVSEMFAAGIVALVTDLFKMLGFALLLFWIHPKLAGITFLVVPVLALAAVVFRLKVREAFRAVRVRIARINATLQESVTGMKVIQLYTREKRNLDEFSELNASHRNAWIQSIRYDAALFATVEVAGGITVAVIVGYGTGIIEIGVLYVFIDWMRRFFMPLRDLSAKYSVMQSAMASCERIFELLDVEPDVRDQLDGSAEPRQLPLGARGTVEFDSVYFAYDDEDWVLRDLSFRIEAGERVAFVGATGAGKTSIIKLLSRLYEINRGVIRLDGEDLRTIPQRDLRSRIAMVLQDVFLFSGTVADNIGLSRHDIDQSQIEAAARAVGADDFIRALPKGYETEIHEGGKNLSAGQRQLLSFARALVHGADVLVLDEATSSIDRETEALLQHGVHVLMEGKTALVIAHRLSTIQDVDRIYVLHQGKIVESGNHQMLLEQEGLYARLYRLQYATKGDADVRAQSLSL